MAVRALAVEVEILGSELTSLDLFVTEIFVTHHTEIFVRHCTEIFVTHRTTAPPQDKPVPQIFPPQQLYKLR